MTGARKIFEFLITALVVFFLFCTRLEAQQAVNAKKEADLKLKQLDAVLCKGWNTWNTRSVLSHVLLPACFSINLELLQHASGDTLKEASIGREDYGTKEHVIAGPHAYDGSYTQLSLAWRDIRLGVQSAVINHEFYLLITPVASSGLDSLIVDPEMLWGRTGTIQTRRGVITATTPSGRVRLTVAGGRYSTTGHRMVFSLDHVIALCSDRARSIADVTEKISAAKTSFARVKSKYGRLSDVYDAMQTVLAWNTIYDPVNERVMSPVSRNWSTGWNGWVLFEWDNYLAARMFSLDDKDLAYANAIAITKEITNRGFVPNYASAGGKSEDRSEPPVGSWVVNGIFRKYHEKWFLEEVFDELLRWNRWWTNHRDIDGYLCWGSDPYHYGKIAPFLIKGIGTKKGAQWESGLDNSPMWDNAVFDSTRHRMMQADVGLMSLYIVDCQNLSEIAIALGKTSIAKELTQRAARYSKTLATLWDDHYGLFLNKNLITGQFSHRLSPTLFYPLLAKVPTQEQAARMIREHFYNPDEFWGQYIMPSIARNDSAFKDNRYWRGRIWAPMNYLVYCGIRNYRLPDAQKDLAGRSKKLLLKTWLSEHHVYENYNATTGQGNDSGMSDPFYHWGALLGYIDLIEYGYAGSE